MQYMNDLWTKFHPNRTLVVGCGLVPVITLDDTEFSRLAEAREPRIDGVMNKNMVRFPKERSWIMFAELENVSILDIFVS